MTAQKNEGEGNQTAARVFNRAQKRFAESGKVAPAAQDAEHALHTPEGEELRAAEERGKQRSHGEDPEVLRRKPDTSRGA